MDSRRTLLVISVSLGIFFEALDIAIVNLAMPLIQKDFSLPGDSIQWIQTVYVLLYGGFLILGGKLSDNIGRKKIFMIGSFIFLSTSLAAALAPSFLFLCFARGLQGIGAAFVMPAAFSIITTTFHDPLERNKALGIFGSFAALGSGSGLSLGGIVASYLGWQWIFFINVPVIAISIVIGMFVIDSDRVPQKNSKTDVVSAIALTFGVLLLTYIIHDLKNIRRDFIMIFLLLGLSAVCFWIFIRRSNSANPLIPFHIFKHPLTLTGNGVMVLMGAFFTGYLFIISLVMQSYMNFSSAKAGLALLPFSILSAFVAKIVLPRLLQKINTVLMGVIGMSFMTAGGITLLLAMAFNFPLWIVLFSVACVTGIGIAVCFVSLNIVIVQPVPANHHGLSSSFTNTCFFLGGGIGLAIIGAFIPSDLQLSPWISACVLTTYAFAGAVLMYGSYVRFKRTAVIHT